MPESKQLALAPVDVICTRHGEPFRAQWPAGYPGFVAIGLQALLSDPAFATRVKVIVADPEFSDITDEIESIRFLLSQKPLCCSLGPEALLGVYKELASKMQLWEARHCTACGRHSPGCRFRQVQTPLVSRYGAPVITRQVHLCFHCIARGQGVL